MNELNQHRNVASGSPAAAEESLLDSVLTDTDRLLADSLREDERRRRRRRLLYVTLLIGGIVMGATLVAVLAGWLTLFTPPPDAPVEKTATQGTLDRRAAVAQAEERAAEGWQHWQQQQFREAAERFEQAVELDPGAANAWNGLGWARFNGGDAERAVEAFEKCVELQPRHPAALNGLGQVYLSWREYDQAEKFLKRAAPQAPAAWYGLARLYLLTGKYREAAQWLTKISRTQPEDTMVQQMLKAARNRELPEPLRRQIEPPGRADNSEGESASATGWQQFNRGQMRSAELNFRTALAKDPDHLPAINGLAFSLLNQGNVGEAKTYFEKYLAIEPEAPGPLNGMARCLKAEGKVEEAIEAWERGYRASPGPTAHAVGLATTYLEIGEHSKAIPYFEELVKAQPENEEFKKGLEAAREGAQK
jgi:tetratricopeptide (TPR) repeat protein